MAEPMETPRVLARARNNSCLGQERCHVTVAAVGPTGFEIDAHNTQIISTATP